MGEKNYRSGSSKSNKKYIDKRLDPNRHSLAQKRLGQLGVNDDISQEIIIELQKENRYLQRKVKSIGITLGIVIRELEKNGYTFALPGRKRSNTERDERGQIAPTPRQLQAEMDRQDFNRTGNEEYEDLPF